jgi:hypothetical protein
MADAAEPEPEPEPAEEGGKKGKTAKDMTEDEAATKIQAAVRGKKGRGKKKKKALVQLMVETEAYPEDQRAELEELDLKKLRKMAKKAGVPKAEIHRVAPLQGSKKKNLAGAAGAAKQTAAEKAKAVNELRKAAAKEVAALMGGKGAFVREEGRGCTDCLFCLLFIAYWGLMCYLILFALEHGDIDRLIAPRDMEMNSCGMETGGVDMTAYSSLYLPNPANDKIQICVDGCPGGSTGTCTGNLTRNYLVVDGQEVSTGSAGSTLGALSSLAGLKVPGPDKYDREPTCVEKGDCSDGQADLLEADCVKFGVCLNGTEIVSEPQEKRKCLCVIWAVLAPPVDSHRFSRTRSTVF